MKWTNDALKKLLEHTGTDEFKEYTEVFLLNVKHQKLLLFC